MTNYQTVITNYKQGMLQIAELETEEQFRSLRIDFIRQSITGALTTDKYVKLDNRLTDLYDAQDWS